MQAASTTVHGEQADRMRREFAAVSASPAFERAPVMRRLLDFLVRATLAGQGAELKAYTVAVEGLGRDANFDAQTDSYPRVQVGRLRRMLDAYYAARPPLAGERLTIKSGAYRVELTPVAEPAPVAAVDEPLAPAPSPAAIARPRRRARLLVALALLATVAIILLAARFTAMRAPARVADAPVLELGPINASGPRATILARGARTVLADAVHRTWLVRVREAGTPGGERATYRLVGEADTTGTLGGWKVVLTLFDVRSGNQLWSQSASVAPGGLPLTDALRPMLSALIRPFGAIATHQRGLAGDAASASGYRCMLAYDRYFRDRDPGQRDPVAACIARTIAAEPLSAPALAAASALELDPALGPDTPERRTRASDFARRAVAADPNSAEAQLADARAAFRAGQCTRGGGIADRAVALNPYNPETIGLLGYLLSNCDDPRAEPMLLTAIRLDPDVPVFYRVALVLEMIERGDVRGAIAISETTRPPGEGMTAPYALLGAMTDAARGDLAAARADWARIAARSGKVAEGPDAVLAQYLWVPMFRAKVLRYLRERRVVT